MYSRGPFAFLILMPAGTMLSPDAVDCLASALDPRFWSSLREVGVERRGPSSVSADGCTTAKPAWLLRAAAVFRAAPARIFDVTRCKRGCAGWEAGSTG